MFIQQTLLSLLPRTIARFQIMSDLHLEVGQQYSTFCIPSSAPYLILAGDIGRLSDYHSYLDFLRSQCDRFAQVFLILGNHEFFGVSREEGLRLAKALEQEPALDGKLVILNRTRIDLEAHQGITLLGCTLQSRILPEAREIVKRKVKDFQRIVNWTMDDHNTEHALDVEWLQEQIRLVRSEENGSKRRIVVITHHAPSMRETCRPRDVDNPWSSAFGTDLLGDEGVSALSDVQWWIFGHTHYTTQFSKGNVKLMSNQRGYVFPKNPEQKPAPTTALQSLIRKVTRLSGRGTGTFNVEKVIKI